jgi:hypothetical protein
MTNSNNIPKIEHVTQIKEMNEKVKASLVMARSRRHIKE